MDFRIGYGYDVHRLQSGYPLWIGGVQIEYHLGAVGHSDADVLLHAICDALLGAAGLRDIGVQFPDTAPEFKGISSLLLLSRVNALLANHGFRIGNLDSTVVLQKPRIAPFIPSMQQKIADTLSLPPDRVSVKATTSEGLGFEGRLEGISASAVALVYSLPEEDRMG